MAQWLPLYESDEETVKTELATFSSVFPDATLWGNYLNGDGYDLVLIGRIEDSSANTNVDINRLQQRLDQPSYARVAASLADAQFPSAVDLLASYVGRAAELAPILAGAQINHDLNMRLQYLAGFGLNSGSAPRMYNQLLSYRKFPDGWLTGTGEPMERLRTLFGRPHRTF